MTNHVFFIYYILLYYYMEKYNQEEESLFQFISEYFIQIVLFLCVFVIIFVVEYINHINSKLFVVPSAIPISNTFQTPVIQLPIKKKRKHK